jgi:Arc/MetJ family transcription regulator
VRQGSKAALMQLIASKHQTCYDLMMRTTITLDPDVAALLARAQKKLHAKPKALINDALREGLNQLVEEKKVRKTLYSTSVVSLGSCKLPNLDNISEAITIAEGEGFR